MLSVQRNSRPARGLVTATLALALLPAFAWGQAAKKPTSEDKILLAKDGARINVTYFPSSAGKNAPVAILLHGKGGNRLVWQTGSGQIPSFAAALQQNDFAVVTVDLRGHGQNIANDGAAPANKKGDAVKLTGRDYAAMVALDLEAVKKFLLEEHENEKLNINKLALVGADFSSIVSLLYADLDWSKEPYDDAAVPALRTPRGQDVRALILISPDSTVPGLVPNQSIARIRALQMPVMIAVGEKDTLDKGAAKKLSEQIMPKKEEKPHVFLETYPSKFRGTDLLNKQTKLEAQMYKFLDDYVKKSPGEWRTRKSPLNN